MLERELDMDDILPEDVEMVAQGIRRAAALYPDTAAIRGLQVAAMKAAKDFSWVKATRQYVDHFVVRRRRAPRRARARRSLLRPGEGRPGSLRNLCRNLPPPPPLPSEPAGLTRHPQPFAKRSTHTLRRNAALDAAPGPPQSLGAVPR